MGITSRLCNPTPWEVTLPWEPGRELVIPPDGFVELTHEQLLDFRPAQPGSDEVKKQTEFFGIFLFDSDISYDQQALDAVTRCADILEKEHQSRMLNVRNMRVAGGMTPDEDTMNDLERQMGLDGFRKKAVSLRERAKVYASAVEDADVRKKETIDFTRTCLATNPPQEFASPTALTIFLSENPEIAEKHNALVSAMEGSDGPSTA